MDISFEHKVNLDQFDKLNDRYEKLIHINERIDDVYRIDVCGHFVEDSEYLICTLPSAQSSKSPIMNPVFHRWSWYKHFKSTSFISISDPALYKSKIAGTWFMSNSDINIIEELSNFIYKLASIVNIEPNKIILYGSSMGGFGALMLATYLNDALAIAEVPQLDMRKYPFKSALNNIQNHLLDSEDFYQFSERYTERVDVLSRISQAGSLPSFKVITNAKDESFNEHLTFFKEVNIDRANKSVIGTCSMYVSSNAVGHKPLPSTEGINLVKSAMREGWSTQTKS